MVDQVGFPGGQLLERLRRALRVMDPAALVRQIVHWTIGKPYDVAHSSVRESGWSVSSISFAMSYAAW